MFMSIIATILNSRYEETIQSLEQDTERKESVYEI